MCLLNWSDGLGKKRPGPPHRTVARGARAVWQEQGNEGQLVNPGQIERLESNDHGLTSQTFRAQPVRRFDTPAEMTPQGGLIETRKFAHLTLHVICRIHGRTV